MSNELLHIWAGARKTYKMAYEPSEDSDQPGIRPVWSESTLSAWRKLGSLATHWAHSEDSGQNGRMPRLIWVFAGRTRHFVDFVVSWLNDTFPFNASDRLHFWAQLFKASLA